MLVVTHDRWFLDAVCTATWEVVDGGVHQYEGGYAAYVLARAERARVAAVREERRQAVLRKELAWLRRGPPARTSKPKFRIEAANALIADEPEPRDRVELLRFAAARLGDKVLEAEDVSVGVRRAARCCATSPGGSARATAWRWSASTARARPRCCACSRASSSRRRAASSAARRVRLAHLSQDTAEIPGELRVLESLEAVKRRATLSDGREITAGMLAERFGFRGDRGRTLVRDLSGGERRRLQLMRLLMGEPNVLLLDEPTNDLDIDTLTALEDLLDGWPGTLVVVSHDRYFVERVCDDVYALRTPAASATCPAASTSTWPSAARCAEPGRRAAPPGAAAQAVIRAARKEVARLERALERLGRARGRAARGDGRGGHRPRPAARAAGRAGRSGAEREALEAAWLEAAETLED